VGTLETHPDTQSANAIRLLLLTGARRGEVLGMKWPDLVFGMKPTWRRANLRPQPSAAVPVCVFNGLAQTVGALPPPLLASALPSALLATVRRVAAAKPLTELGFGIDADDADAADGCAPAFLGAKECETRTLELIVSVLREVQYECRDRKPDLDGRLIGIPLVGSVSGRWSDQVAHQRGAGQAVAGVQVRRASLRSTIDNGDRSARF
jgi:hypothetical protein